MHKNSEQYYEKITELKQKLIICRASINEIQHGARVKKITLYNLVLPINNKTCYLVLLSFTGV